MKGAFARARGVRRGAGACGIVFGAFAGASGVRWEEGAFAGVFAGCKKHVYDFFPTDVRFFCKFEFYVHIHYYF